MPKLKKFVATTPEELAEILGLSPADAAEWRGQILMVKRLQEIVAKSGLTHTEVAKQAGTSRTKITSILNGNVDHVSTDLLIRILSSLGYQVRFTVSKAKRAA